MACKLILVIYTQKKRRNELKSSLTKPNAATGGKLNHLQFESLRFLYQPTYFMEICLPATLKQIV